MDHANESIALHQHQHPQHQLHADDDLDAQIEQATRAQNEYDDWKRQLAAECHRNGTHFPTGYALQRAWNAEQRKRAEARKAIAAVERRKQAIIAQIGKLSEELQQIDAQLASAVLSTIHAAKDEQLPDFDALDAELMRVQQQKELADKTANREQSQLFGTPEE